MVEVKYVKRPRSFRTAELALLVPKFLQQLLSAMVPQWEEKVKRQ